MSALDVRKYPGLGRVYFPAGARQEIDFIYDEIFRRREYLQHGLTLRPGDTVFDVGANVGLFALFAAQACQNQVTLYCFEPIPETYGCLEKNLRERTLPSSVRLNLFACGLTRLDGPPSAEFTYFPGVPGNSTMVPEEKAALARVMRRLAGDRSDLAARASEVNPWRLPLPRLAYRLLAPLMSRQLGKLVAAFESGRKMHCPLKTLAEVCREHQVRAIDLLKIDVEGAELEVLEGMDDSAWKATRQIVLEAHDLEGRVNRIESLLAEHGFRDVAIVQPLWSETLRLDAYTIYARR